MKKVKLKEFVWNYGKEGEIIEVSNYHAKYLIRKNLAIFISDVKK